MGLHLYLRASNRICALILYADLHFAPGSKGQ